MADNTPRCDAPTPPDEDSGCPTCGEGPYDYECDVGMDCGRWSNGRLMKSCAKAGSEECDFECPYRDKP